MQQQRASCCPAVDGFFLTAAPAASCGAAAAACLPPVSQEAAAAVSAAVTAARLMCASNSIELCLGRAARACSSRTMHTCKLSLGNASVELAVGSADAGAASAYGPRLATPRSPAAATAAGAGAGAGAIRSSQAVSALESAGQVTSRHTSSCMHCTDGLVGAAAGISSPRCSISAGSSAPMRPRAAAAGAAAAVGGEPSAGMPTARSSHSRQVPVRVFSAVDAGVWQAAEAAAGATSWSLCVRLLQPPTAALEAQHAQQGLPAQQLAGDTLQVACTTSGSRSSGASGSNVMMKAAQDIPQQQQQQQQVADAKAALAPVPRLQLQKLRNMELDLTDSCVLPYSKDSSSAAQGNLPSAAVSAIALQQQQVLVPRHRPVHVLPPDSTAGITPVPAGVALLPSWRSALTTRWQPGGRFKQQQAHPSSDGPPLQGSQTSRL
ncbi:hypothetical protein COO60DRAFT_476358 [Scenedesmus sp. NREL 46B-D3]|nr:hypothetical protein COO60DRAFT_476358 [Scenedesmus sp. NREL 46B-D3]